MGEEVCLYHNLGSEYHQTLRNNKLEKCINCSGENPCDKSYMVSKDEQLLRINDRIGLQKNHGIKLPNSIKS